jgi:hypothetical protein
MADNFHPVDIMMERNIAWGAYDEFYSRWVDWPYSSEEEDSESEDGGWERNYERER